MDVSESSQGSSKDDKEGEVSSTCNDNRNNEEQSVEVASNSNNPSTSESSEPSSIQEGTSTKRSLSPDTSNAVGGSMEGCSFPTDEPVEAGQSGERVDEHRSHATNAGGSDSLPSVSSEASVPESNQPIQRGNQEEMLTSTTEDPVIVAGVPEDETVAISESGEEMENRPSSAGQNNSQEDLISVSSASNAQNSDGAGNSNIPGLMDVQEEIDAAVDGNVPSQPGAADSTTLELMELSDDSSSSVGENFGVSTTARDMWPVSTTQSYHSNPETPSSERLHSAYSHGANASTSRNIESAQPMQRECQQSDTVSATENNEVANVSTTIRDITRPVVMRERIVQTSTQQNVSGPHSARSHSAQSDSVSASVNFPVVVNREVNRRVMEQSSSSSSNVQQGLQSSPASTHSTLRKSVDSVSSSKDDCISKVEEASGSQPSTSRNQESSIDTTTGVHSKSSQGTPSRRSAISEGHSADLSSFSITTSNSGRNMTGDSQSVSRGVEDTTNTILRLIGLQDNNSQCSKSQTDSRVSTSGQSSVKGGATSTTNTKSSGEREKSCFMKSSVVPSTSSPFKPSPQPHSIAESNALKLETPSGSVSEDTEKENDNHVSKREEVHSNLSSCDKPSTSNAEKSNSKPIASLAPESSKTSNVSSRGGENLSHKVVPCHTKSEIPSPSNIVTSQTKSAHSNQTAVKTATSIDSCIASTPSCSSMPPSVTLSKVGAAVRSNEPSTSVSGNETISCADGSHDKKGNVSSAQPSSDLSTAAIEVEEEVISCEVVTEALVRGESEVEWSEDAVLIGEEVSMSAVEEAFFPGKSELDRFTSGISMESSVSTFQSSVKVESGPLKRIGSPPKDEVKKPKIEKEEDVPPPSSCQSSMRTSLKSDVPSSSKRSRSSPPRDNLEAILSAMEGSSVDADVSSASCTPPSADPQNSNEGSGADEMNMESIMADLLKSKMDTMDADSGSDDVQIIEVIEHPRKEAESAKSMDQGVQLGERILVEIGEGGGIRVGPMQPSRGSIRTTRGLPGITVMRGGVRGRGRGSRSVLGGRGSNQVAVRRGVGRGGGGRGSGSGRGVRGGGVDAATGAGSMRGMVAATGLRGMSTPSPRGISMTSPRGGMAISSPRGGIISPRGSGKGISERGYVRGVTLGRPPGRGLGASRGRGGDASRGGGSPLVPSMGVRGRGASVRGMGVGGGRGSAVLGRGIPSNIGRGLSITVGRGMVVERLPSVSSRGISKEIGIERSGMVVSSPRGMGYSGGRGLGRGGELGIRGSGLSRGMGTGRGVVRGVRGPRGTGRGGRPPGRGGGRGSRGGGRGSPMGGISLNPEISLLPQELKMPHVQLDMSVGGNMGTMPGISAVKREGLTIIPHGPLPSMVKDEDSNSHDVIVVAEVGGNGSVKVEQGSMERLSAMHDDKLSVPVTVQVKMEDVGEFDDGLLTKRKRKPRKPLELSPEISRPKRPRKAKTKSDDDPKPRKGKKAPKKATAKKASVGTSNLENALKNGSFSEKLPVPIDGHTKPTIQIFEEETRMSADSNSRSQTPARTLPPAGLNPEEEASQGSLLSNGTTESAKKKVRLEVYDPDSNAEFTAENLAEYQWPLNDKNAEQYMIQEQISEYLGVKSFKRKYPDLKRRTVEAEEKSYLRERGLVSESLCDLGLTAVNSSEVLDIMYSDFQEKYEEYRRVTRDRQAKEISNRQKAFFNPCKHFLLSAVSGEKNKQSDYKRRAMKSAASWNSSFNKERKEERRCCFDLQSFTIHYPKAKGKLMTREKPKLGHYPISLIPGQYTDYYKRYTPTELRYYPLNTVLYGPMKPNEMEEHASDGSQSESEESSSSDDSSSSSSEATQDTEETCSTADLESESTQGAGGEGASKSGSSAGPICKSCGGDRNHNKQGRPELLIQCAQCESSGHPSCLDLTLDMVPHIKSYDWQCTDCKTCIECKDPADEDKMLFCDMCDRGYHIYCVGLRKVPSGSWHCQVCSPAGPTPDQRSKEQLGSAENSNGSMPHWQTENKKGERPISQIMNTSFPKVLLSKI